MGAADVLAQLSGLKHSGPAVGSLLTPCDAAVIGARGGSAGFRAGLVRPHGHQHCSHTIDVGDADAPYNVSKATVLAMNLPDTGSVSALQTAI